MVLRNVKPIDRAVRVAVSSFYSMTSQQGLHFIYYVFIFNSADSNFGPVSGLSDSVSLKAPYPRGKNSLCASARRSRTIVTVSVSIPCLVKPSSEKMVDFNCFKKIFNVF